MEMTGSRLTLVLLAGIAAACSASDTTFATPDTDNFVIQAYLYAGERVADVSVRGVLPIDADSTEVAEPVTGATITLVRNGARYALVPTSGEPGRYHYPGTDVTVAVGDRFGLAVTVGTRTATAETTVPEAPVGLEMSADSMVVDDTFQPGFGGFGSMGGGIIARWSNPGSRFYFLVVDNLEEAPEALPFTERFGGFAPRFVSQPTAADSSVIRSLSLTHYGRHRLRLYRVNDEYADLYRGLSQDSRDLNEPPTNVKNALGVFTAFAADSAFFAVR
ncbi:MAG TPA: DUF4249 family protein [Longimicrobiales bacterium]|nr:DUF4249 family protein [Longimicrobiales bacterium]